MSTNTPSGTPAKTPRARKTPAATSRTTAPATPPAAVQPRSQREAHGTHAEQPKRRQQKVGRVTSNKMQKTIVVAVESLKQHPIYKRTYKYTNKFKAHDERNDARIGDTVRIEETRPLSKEKRWRLVEIIKRAEQTVAPEIIAQQLEQQEGLVPPGDDVDGGPGGTA
jgi:small subunit ribosomal protein S17